MIVVAIQDHKTRIEVGYGLEGAIPDAIAKRIIEEFMIPRFRDGDYFQGVFDGIDKLITKIDGEELPKTGASAPPSDINVDSPITEEEFRTIEQKDDFDKDILDKYIVFLPVLIPVAIFAVAILITSGIVGFSDSNRSRILFSLFINFHNSHDLFCDFIHCIHPNYGRDKEKYRP